MKRFGRGLVVGKFCPLHRGHQYLIDAALAQCDELVLISYTRPAFAGCDALAREHWLSTLYPQTRRLVLDEARFAALASSLGWPRAVLPENDAPEEVHRELVGWLCHRALDVGIDAVFTSEAYGDGFATALTRFLRYHRDTDHPPVQHVCVDRARQAVPVSGTALRRDPHGLRHHLSPVVYAAFVQRVCLLGGESSGKTTLAQALAEQWNTAWVPEYGRERWEAQGGRLAFDDLTDIGRIQLARERAACARAHRWLFCDTGPLTTLLYCHDLFGRADAELERLAGHRYEHVFLCAPDFPFVQDGTRRDERFRLAQDRWYRRELRARGIGFEVLAGNIERRMARVRAHLTTAGLATTDGCADPLLPGGKGRLQDSCER